MSKILLFGGSGFIGSNLASFFLQQGFEMHLVLRNNSSLWRISSILSEINVHYDSIANSENIDSLIRSIKPEIIVIASGVVKGESITDQYGVIESNLALTVNIVNSYIRSNADILLNTGSAKEYGFSPTAINENYHGIPIGLYGVTKKAATEYSQFMSLKYMRKIITLRLFTPYGPFDSVDRLIPNCIVNFIQGRVPNIRNLDGIRDYIYIDDVSRAYLYTINKISELNYGSVINVGNGAPIMVKEILSILSNIISKEYNIEHFGGSYVSNSIDTLYSDNEKLKSLGWKGNDDLYSGLNKTVEWFKNNIQRYREIK